MSTIKMISTPSIIEIPIFFTRKLWSTDGKYVATRSESVPYRWAAPEVLVALKFSSKSDVWAFGEDFC